MKARLAVILSLSMFVIARNGQKIEDRLRGLGWKEAKDVYKVVDETNQEKFGLPIGTKLKLDRKTQLYKPPKLSANFTADDRMTLQWRDDLTRKTYCKVGPGNLTSSSFTYNHYWHSWCRNSDGENLCCDNRICECNAMSIDCECKMKGI